MRPILAPRQRRRYAQPYPTPRLDNAPPARRRAAGGKLRQLAGNLLWRELATALVASCRNLPQVAAKRNARQVAASCRKLPQLAATCRGRGCAASCRKLPWHLRTGGGRSVDFDLKVKIVKGQSRNAKVKVENKSQSRNSQVHFRPRSKLFRP